MNIGDVSFVWQYVESVLETSGDDFESTDDLYEAIGEVSFLRKKSKRNLIWIIEWHTSCDMIMYKTCILTHRQVLHEMEEDKSEKEIR